jgi:predicted dehydrogenase
MATTYRLGVIGFAHMHINELMRLFGAEPNVEWVACADTVPDRPERVTARFTRAWNRQHALETIGIPRAYDDYREMLARERLDLVLFCPENARHGEVAEAIAAHGAHMVTEKPMATTLPEALRMVRAAQATGVTLVVNWPSTWSPGMRLAHRLLGEGAIGRPWQVTFRAGSLGPLAQGSTHPGIDGTATEMTDAEKGATWWHHRATGGGALLDYASYGACLARWYLGEPAQAAFALAANIASPYGDAEDNAVVSVRFPGALAVLTATWSTVDHGVPTGPVIYGDTGTLVVERTRGGTDTVRLIQSKGADPEVIEAPPLPAGRDTLAREVLHHLATGEPLHETLALPLNLDAQAILDAAARSVTSGRLELVDTTTWGVARPL